MEIEFPIVEIEFPQVETEFPHLEMLWKQKNMAARQNSRVSASRRSARTLTLRVCGDRRDAETREF